ncbi:MAG: PmoA family protein [Bacteroidota bacterium]|nr:PmoA family protein [Bacteroidota bacterium]MDP4245216.1 PmoA family protein [Bacteroidota bacterium]MDP4253984.1 PmoA family protein [Bacteroidota bacterium]
MRSMRLMLRKLRSLQTWHEGIFPVLCLLLSTSLRAQRIATFRVQLPAATSGLDLPVSAHVALDSAGNGKDRTYYLLELWHGARIPVPFQVDSSGNHTLHWMVKYRAGSENRRVYDLMRREGKWISIAKPASFPMIIAHVDDSALTFRDGHRNLLRYWHATVDPPPGVDSAFRRSGFIHPLWTPHGQPLTRIQPPDHRHHYGLWNPWTHVLFEKDTVDFWNLGDKKGTVRFAKFISVTSGPVYAEFQAAHEHVVLKKDGSRKVAMDEVQTVRVYKSSDSADYYMMDITSQLRCATQSPVLLLTYRYGGLGWRATGVWNKNNSEVLTSEGKDRKTADGSKARWCIVEGSLDSLAPDKYGDYGGAVMLSSPANYNHPEPLRIWPENSNGRGDLFVNFDPTKDKDWLLEPGKTYTLKYRLVVFNGRFGKDKAESAWQYFADPPAVSLDLINHR